MKKLKTSKTAEKQTHRKQTLIKEIKKYKEEQRKLLRIIKEELKKADQFRVSIEGLEKLSKSSIKSIQTKREKSVFKAKRAFDNFSSNTIKLKKAEEKFSLSV